MSEILNSTPAPRNRTDLFLSCTLLSLQGFGGVMAVVQRELVERKRWLTREEFIEDWAIAQTLPGPNAVNLSVIVGHRYFGASGALAAFAGMLLAPLMLILCIGMLYAPFADQPQVAGALKGMGAVAAGLILATGMRLIGALRNNPLGMKLCLLLTAVCFVAVALVRLPLIYPLFGIGLLGSLLTYAKLKP